MPTCLFCSIAKDTSQSHVINEDSDHLAILDAFPLIEGQTVVTTKKHHPGYYFEMPEDEYNNLMLFVKKTANKLDKGLGVERTMMVAQGYSIDHVHIKLFPVKEVHATKVSDENYEKLTTLMKQWYSGFIVSMSGRNKASDEDLKRLVRKINGT